MEKSTQPLVANSYSLLMQPIYYVSNKICYLYWQYLEHKVLKLGVKNSLI